MTTRGLKTNEIKRVGKIIVEVVSLLEQYRLPENKEDRAKYIKQFKKEIGSNRTIKILRKEVKGIALRFDIP
jgi:glycine/serine hydroxymethyltransferase